MQQTVDNNRVKPESKLNRKDSEIIKCSFLKPGSVTCYGLEWEMQILENQELIYDDIDIQSNIILMNRILRLKK